MSEPINENTSPIPAPAPAPSAPDPSEWSGPSKEEWNAVIEQNKKLSSELEGLNSALSYVEPAGPARGEGFDLNQLDMTDPYQAAWLMDQIVSERLNSVTPYVKNAAQDQGQKHLQELLGTHENALKNDFPDGFDHKLAERAAFAFFDETGDAEGAVEAAARYAAEVRHQERNTAVEAYRKSNSKGGAFSDLGATESGVHAPPPLKTYDEVLDKYTQQTEV